MNLKVALKIMIEDSETAQVVDRYKIELERQCPAGGVIYVPEPLKKGGLYALSWGLEDGLVQRVGILVEDVRQIADDLYICELVDAARLALDTKVEGTILRATIKDVLIKLGIDLGLDAEILASPPPVTATIWPLGTLRNTLDQMRLIYKLDKERFEIDVAAGKIRLVDEVEGEAVDLSRLFIEENEQGVEFLPLPSCRPHVKVSWRGDRIVDYVCFRSNGPDYPTMILRFADEL